MSEIVEMTGRFRPEAAAQTRSSGAAWVVGKPSLMGALISAAQLCAPTEDNVGQAFAFAHFNN